MFASGRIKEYKFSRKFENVLYERKFLKMFIIMVHGKTSTANIDSKDRAKISQSKNLWLRFGKFKGNLARSLKNLQEVLKELLQGVLKEHLEEVE